MNTDIVQRITHLIANISKVPYTNFQNIKSYMTTTEYEASFGAIFDAIDSFYSTRNSIFPDFDWIRRQFPSIFSTYIDAPFHNDDIYVLETLLRDESYKNKVLSATWQDDLNKASDLLTEYKQLSVNLVKAPTTSKEVFANFDEEKEIFGHGVKMNIDTRLDEDVDFLPYKGFTALVAPTKSFKTMTTCNIVYDAIINQSKNVIYLTLEDQYRSIWANLLCKHSYLQGTPLSTAEIKKYKLSDDKSKLFKKVQASFDESMTGKLVVLSSETVASFTPDIVESQLDFYEKLWGKVDMIVVDHLSISDDPIPGMNLSGPALSKAYVRFYTKLAIERNLVFLGLGQVTREYTEKLIKGDKMRSTGVANTSEMERSATIMLCTFATDEMKKAGNLGITVVVNRNGPSDTTYTVPIKPEFAIVGDTFVEKLDEETYNAIAYGDLDIPLKQNLNFGISFAQFQSNLAQV